MNQKNNKMYDDARKKRISNPDELHDKLLNLGLKESTFEEFQKYDQYSLDGDKDPRWKLKYRIYNQDDIFIVIFEREELIYSSKIFGYPLSSKIGYLLGKVNWADDDIDYSEY